MTGRVWVYFSIGWLQAHFPEGMVKEICEEGPCPKRWMVYEGKSHEIGWFAGATILGNLHITELEGSWYEWLSPILQKLWHSFENFTDLGEPYSSETHTDVPRNLENDFPTGSSWCWIHKNHPPLKLWSIILYILTWHDSPYPHAPMTGFSVDGSSIWSWHGQVSWISCKFGTVIELSLGGGPPDS